MSEHQRWFWRMDEKRRQDCAFGGPSDSQLWFMALLRRFKKRDPIQFAAFQFEAAMDLAADGICVSGYEDNVDRNLEP